MTERGKREQIPPMGRKHLRPADFDNTKAPKKKIRLDSLLLKLSISKEEEKPFDINPLLSLDNYDLPRKKKQPVMDTYLSEKIMQGFKDKLLADLAVGHWYLPLGLIAYHFQRWVRRLFNAFVRQYNSWHPNKKPVRPFRDYFKIMQLVRLPEARFSVDDLWGVVTEQNQIEQRTLARRKELRSKTKELEELNEEELAFRSSKYAYWDRLAQISEDLEMEDYVETDTDMEVESP